MSIVKRGGLAMLASAALLAAGPVPDPEWQVVEWCGPGIRFEVPTFGRELDTSLTDDGGRIQNYRIDELRPLTDGFYEYRSGDYFLELRFFPEGEAGDFDASACDGDVRRIDGLPGSSWCRVGMELGGEASYTHLARISVAGGVLDLDIDGSALPEPVPRALFESVRPMRDACRRGAARPEEARAEEVPASSGRVPASSGRR